MGFLVTASWVQAKKTKRPTGLVTHYTKSKAPAVAKLEFSQAAPQSIILINPSGEEGASTFAKELSSRMMSKKLVREMEGSYGRRLEDLEMNRSFQMTSNLSDKSSIAGKDSKAELSLRKDMARNMQRQMVLRGIPEFIQEKSSSKEVKQVVYVATRLAESTKVSVKTKARWEYTLGANPYNQKVSMTAKKGDFSTSLSTRLSGQPKKNGIFNVPTFENGAPQKNLRADISRRIKKHKVAASYTLNESHIGPYYDYSFTKNLTCGLESGYSMSKKTHNSKAFMSYAF